MARGFVSGVIWGGVVSLVVAGVASVLGPLPMPPEVGETPGAAQAPERVVDAANGEAAREIETSPIPVQQAPQTPAPEPDTLQAVDAGTTTPAAAPETGGAEGLSTPDQTAETAAVTLQGDAPVLPNPQALAPIAPPAADDVSITTEPAQPPEPDVDLAASAFDTPAPVTEETTEIPELAEATVPPELPESRLAPAPEEEPAPAEEESARLPEPLEPDAKDPAFAQVAEPEPEPGADAPETAATPEPPAPAAAEPEIAQAPETATVAPEIAAPGASATPGPAAVTPAPETGTDRAEDVPEPEIAAVAPPRLLETETPRTAQSDASDGSDRPAIGKPAAITAERDTGVTINRLPTTASVPQADAQEADTAAAGANVPAINRYGQDFSNPDGKPLMSIVLIDGGSDLTGGEIGIAALRSFPYPISFAVDVRLPDAANRMTLYRDEGFEVLAMLDLPRGAAPSDAEVSLADAIGRLPEVVGVLEGTGAGLQPSRETGDQVTAILAEAGHGLVTQDQGLNTMAKLAIRNGVPAAPIFRDFDSKGQTPTVIRRFLDQAAFKAGQEGAVIMLGRMRPDTISALLLWGLQDRASQVALAPISAVLKAQIAE